MMGEDAEREDRGAKLLRECLKRQAEEGKITLGPGDYPEIKGRLNLRQLARDMRTVKV